MQASYPQARQSNSRVMIFFILAIVSILVALLAPSMVMAVDTSMSHGDAKHLSGAAAIRQCLNQNGPMQTWVNPSTGRRAQVCQVGPETYGIQIIEEGDGGTWNEITTFLKNKMTRIDQVEQYLTNRGYTPMK